MFYIFEIIKNATDTYPNFAELISQCFFLTADHGNWFDLKQWKMGYSDVNRILE